MRRKLGTPIKLPDVNHNRSTRRLRNLNPVSNQSVQSSIPQNQPGSKVTSNNQNGIDRPSSLQDRSVSKRPFNGSEPITDCNNSSSLTQKVYGGETPAKRRSTNEYGYGNLFLHHEERRTISNLYPELNRISRFYKWVIKVLVLSKSSIHTYSGGTGKVFSLNLIDETGEIRCTGFMDVIDKLYNFIEVGKVYYIGNLRVVPPNFPLNNIELYFTSKSIMEEADDDAKSLISKLQFNFKSIDGIPKIIVGEKVDIIGICTNTVFEEFTSQDGQRLKKRELTLVDESKCSISLAIWGAEAQQYNHYLPIVVARGAVVCDFLGSKNLSLPKTGIILYNPDLKQSHDLRNWYTSGGFKEEPLSITTRRCEKIQCKLVSFKEVEDLGLSAAEPGMHFLTKGTILQVRAENSYYKGCPLTTCHRKLIEMENGRYRCDKCDSTYMRFKYEIATTMFVGDWSGSQRLSVFSKDAEFLFGKTPTEIAMIGNRYGESSNEFQNIINRPIFKQYMFRYRGKVQFYNNIQQVQKISVKVENITNKYNAYLVSNIVDIIC